MFKRISEILSELRKKDFQIDPAARKIYELLSQPLTPDLVSIATEYISEPIFTDIAQIPISEETQNLLALMNEEDALKYLQSDRIALTLQYMVMLADAFSIFRMDSKCMTMALSVYRSYFTLEKDYHSLDTHLPKYFELIMYENLVLLYSDKSSPAYNLQEATLNLELFDAFSWNSGYTAHLENPEFLYAYAHIANLVKLVRPSFDAITMYKKAIAKGHQRATTEFREVCRAKMLCTKCGGKLKGFFIKKCTNCGMKKDY